MTALFSLPIEGENLVNSMPVLILGWTSSEEFLVVDDEGRFSTIGVDWVRTNWRYDWREHVWKEVADGTQDNAPDGGEGFPGSVPELDGDSSGDPVNPQGGPTSGDSGDMDTGEKER